MTHHPSRLSIIVAMSRNGVIGKDNAIPWRLPGELALFKRITMGHPVVMGRKTWESIGRPLPGRTNIVITRNRGYQAAGATVVGSLDAALAAGAGADAVFVIGGAQLYAEALPRATHLYLTTVDADVDGDTRMPKFDAAAWHAVSSERHEADARNPYAYTLQVLERAAPAGAA
jgi:dihydrofolate reductase